MDFKKYLDSTSGQLDEEIQNILELWLKDIGNIDKKLIPLAKEFIKSNFGGKGIRGGLVKLGYELTRNVILNEVKDLSRMRPSNKLRDSSLIAQNDNYDNEIIKIGAAYEILHSSILVHDDIIDKSPTRRGSKSLYKVVGVPQAITLGDLGFFLAVKIIAESNFPDKEKNLSLQLFSKTMVDTAAGQLLDIQKGNPKTLILYKTAYYTISAPLCLGATLAGADKKLLGLLGLFGENLGIAYQIQDDILDGDVLDYSKASGVEYVAEAKKLIPKITSDRELAVLLEQMAEYVIERNK